MPHEIKPQIPKEKNSKYQPNQTIKPYNSLLPSTSLIKQK